jgi:hypothetical protein
MNPTQVARIHELVRKAVAEGLSNLETQNRIASFASGQDERREAFDYLKLLRTQRGEDINIFSGESNLSESFRSAWVGAREKETEPAFTGQALRPTPAEVRAMRDALRTAGRPHGYGTLSKALHASKSTIRRRLGTL